MLHLSHGEGTVGSTRKEIPTMGMYSAMMKQVHEHAKKLEKSGDLDRMFQKREPKPSQPVRHSPLKGGGDRGNSDR